MTKSRKHLWLFGGFRLDTTEHLLYRQSGEVVPLKPKVVETLELLVTERGRLLGKDELLERLWPDAVVEESNLSQNIYLLRKVLGGDLIETVPKRGYRFIAEVEEVFDDETAPVIEDEPLRRRVIVQAENGSKSAKINSLAVLPMTNESDDPNIEYLSDGITESVINYLSQLPQLKVMARSTVFHYKSRDVLPQKAGQELGVRAVLTGRVLQLGDRLIVRTELVDTDTGCQLWGGQYDRYSSDILELQQAIAQEISDKLELKLTREEQNRLTKRYTESTEAYHLLIKGRYHLNKRLTASIQKAIEYFKQAIDVDPVYAPAYVGLADCYPLLNLYGALEPQDAYTKAEAAARRALEIDETFAEAHNSLGVIKLFYKWDWPGAEESFQQAIELKPGYADAHQRYGMLLVAQGRFEEATERLDKAQELDPLSLITKTISGYSFYYGRAYERAAERFCEVIEMDRNYSMAHFRLGLTYAQLRRFDEAFEELKQSAQLSGDRDVVAAQGYVYGLAGRTSEAQAALEELRKREEVGFVSAYDKTLVNVGLGRNEAALNWLEKAYEERSYWLIYLHVDPALDPLRTNPRFMELLRKVAGSEPGPLLPEPKQTSGDEQILQPAPATPMRSHWVGISAVFLVLLLLASGLTFGIMRLVRPKEQPASRAEVLPFENVRLKPLTDNGDIADAVISPDGKSVAIAAANNAVWIQNLETGSRFELLGSSDTEKRRHINFSRSGGHLYFIAEVKGKKNRLLKITVSGGPVEQESVENFWTGVAIAPDEKQFAFIRQYTEQGEQRLLVSDGHRERDLATRKSPDYFGLWDDTVAWSPDGQRIACVEGRRLKDSTVGSVIIVNVADGSEMRLSNDGHSWNYLYDLTWLPEGNGLLVIAREDFSGTFQIWRVSYPDGQWHKVTNDLNNYEKISTSLDGSKLVSKQEINFSNLWLVQSDPKTERQLTFGNRHSDGRGGCSWTPDGQIVFTSNASGAPEIWISNQDGSDPRQLTFNSEASNQPFVTPDGRHIVYRSYRANQPNIWLMDIDGGNRRQLTEGVGEESPSVTPDGRDLIYTSQSGSISTLWRVPLSGGTPKQLNEKFPMWAGSTSPDGKLIAAAFYNTDSLFPWQLGIFASEGGQPIKSFPDNAFRGLASWTPDGQSVMYIANGYDAILKQSIQGGPAVKILSAKPAELFYSFAMSPDNKQFVVARGQSHSDALLFENVK
jgi:Tol biopolymer transport system component/DNA-binding winged helix-turn-helix (wHTH) protein/Flp pilus assembly protein TadD